MKKIFYSALVMALTATAFTACEDVPAPYSINYSENTTPTTPTNNAVNTEATAFTVAEAVQYIADHPNATTKAYVKGKISEVFNFNSTYGSISYWISDNGTAKDLQIYSGLNLNKAKFTAQTDLSVGDEVVVFGDLKAFNKNDGTTINEMDKNNYLVSRTASTTPASTDLNTQATAWTVAEVISQLNSGTTGVAYVKGTITGTPSFSDKYHSFTYNLTDNGTGQEFQVYSGKNIGGADFTGNELSAGMVVIVKGTIKNFTKNGQTIPEMDKNNEIVEIVSGASTSPVTPTPSPTPAPSPTPGTTTPSTSGTTLSGDLVVSAANMGFADRVEATTFTASDGTTFTFSKANGKTAPTFYNNTNPAFVSVRMYAANSLKIVATRKIAKIVIKTTTPANGKMYNGDVTAYAEAGSNQVQIVQNSETQVTFDGLNNEIVTIVDGAVNIGAQLRIVEIAITYAN